jgi:hypothetical protein
MSKPKAPEFLAKAGAALWSDVVGKYDLRTDELRTLEDACATTDMIAALSASWEELGRPLTTKGSMGQEVIHPLIGEIRTQRAARNALWRQLKLPDDAPGAKGNQQREAAQSRWAAAHGAGA